MELAKFITDSLLSIHSALKKVNNELTKDYPVEKKINTFLLKAGSKKNEGEGVHFDLAVAAKADKELRGKAKFGIFVLSSIETKGILSKNYESVSRISFTVEVVRRTGKFNKNSYNK